MSPERPQLLDEPVVLFARPLAPQELDDLLTAARKLEPVAPRAVDRVGAGHALGVAAVPCVFGQAHLLHRRLARERRARFVGRRHAAVLADTAGKSMSVWATLLT